MDANDRPRRRRSRLARPENKTTPKVQSATDAVLGSILINPKCLLELDLSPDDFDLDYQRFIFTTMREMSNRKEAIDVLTLNEAIQKRLASEAVEMPEGFHTWLELLSIIQRDTPTSTNVAHYAKIVQERSRARQATYIASSLVETVVEDVGEIDNAVKALMALTRKTVGRSKRLGDGTAKFIDDLDDLCAGRKKIGIPTGIEKLDRAIGGLCPGHLIVVGARPGMGKTSFGLQVLLNSPTTPTGIISAEMPVDQLMGRAVSYISGVSSHAMRLGKITADDDWRKITEATSAVNAYPIYVDDTPAPKAAEVLRQARIWKHDHDIKVLVIDYIQRIKSSDPRRDRREELADATLQFKEIGRELEIPVVLLAQINREVDKRSDKRPTLSDFKETGALEEEGDVVITLYRNELYEPKNPDTKGIIELAIVKHRHGPTGFLTARFNGACNRIENLDTTADAF